MNDLPRLLFLFQSLPILVPQSIFKLLEKLISKFTWQNQRPRIQLKGLMSAKEKGGLNLPNLKFYYWATQLRVVVAWVVRDLETGFVSVEQNSIPGVPLSSLPFLCQQSQKKLKINNMWVIHTSVTGHAYSWKRRVFIIHVRQNLQKVGGDWSDNNKSTPGWTCISVFLTT